MIVPAAVTDEMTDAIAARLAAITVGDPGDESVRMGPLASLGQREEVRKAVVARGEKVLADAVMSHPFWTLHGAEGSAQLLHFMKNIGFIGGLLLLALTTSRRNSRY